MSTIIGLVSTFRLPLQIVIICAWIVCSIGKNGLFFDISLLLYGTFTDILCSFMGVYFDYKMPRTEITPNTLLHGNMSKIFVLVMIVALTILEMYFWKKFSFVKFSIGLSMMNILILLLIGVVMYMKRGLSDDRNK